MMRGVSGRFSVGKNRTINSKNSAAHIITLQAARCGYKTYFGEVIATKQKLKESGVKQHVPSVPKLAATVILCRESSNTTTSNYKYEMLFVKRRKEARFMPNFYVFPGGLVETTDSQPIESQIFANLTEVLKSDNTKRALRLAAIREVFEESNIFLAHDETPIEPNRLSQWKDKILADHKEFVNMCVELKAKVNMNGLYEWSHWITPEFEKYRYDTHFFFIPIDYTSSLSSMNDAKEIVAHEWIRPDDALKRYKEGDLKLAPPTWYTINEFSQHTTITSLLHHAKEKSDLSPILPIIEEVEVESSKKEGKLLHLYLPGDENSNQPKFKGANRRIEIDLSSSAPYSYVNNIM